MQTKVGLAMPYSAVNYVAFNLSAFACIAFVVFLSSSQPYFLDQVIKLDPDRIGSAIGTLGAADELTAIVSAPLVGALCDKINVWSSSPTSRLRLGGTKLVVLVSFLVIALALGGYGQAAHRLVPDVVFFRCFFAVGVTAAMSMVPVMLNEVTSAGFLFKQLQVWKKRSPASSPLLDAPANHRNGKLSALVGVFTGLGAIFSVSFFLTLPVKLSEKYGLTMETAIRYSYCAIGVVAAAVGLIASLFLYNSATSSSHLPEHIPSEAGYLRLLYNGLKVSRHNRRVRLAYVGSFVARSTTVATSVFIPLVVYNYYIKQGNCGSRTNVSHELPSKKSCYDAYIFSAILTGVAQTVALVSSPLWGFMIDHVRVGRHKTLSASSLCGLLGCIGLCLDASLRVHYSESAVYDPRSTACFLFVSLIGLSQIGTIIASMSLVSSLSREFDRQSMGSIGGLYSLSGGVGILIITKLGGTWSDSWIMGPFFILGGFNAILMACSITQT